MREMRVDQNTSLEALKTFVDQSGSREKIRATRNQDGSFTLYSSKKLGGLKSLVSGRRAERQQTARNAINLVLSNTARLRGVDTGAMAVALGPVTQQLIGRGELRGRAMQGLAAQATERAQAHLPMMHKMLNAVLSGDVEAIDRVATEQADRMHPETKSSLAPGEIHGKDAGGTQGRVVESAERHACR